ncbi:MAG: adenosine deaminase [Bacteroidota bacterium]
MSELTRDEILSWPKTELHCHLDGSLRLETLLELAFAQGKEDILPAQDLESLAEVLRQVDDSETLEAYLAWFAYSIPLMQSEEGLERIAYELAADNAEENVRYLEVRYSPVLHTEEGLSLEAVNDAVLAGLRRAEEEYGIRCTVIICGLRDRYESASLRLAELAVAYKGRGVVGYDLAGGEAGYPPKRHLNAFYHARNNLLNLTIHAGESWGPDAIHQTIFKCGAHRIGHGTSLYRDPELMQYMVDHQIPLEVCPTSNVQTHVVPGFAEHPVSIYVENQVPVTINTDNRLFSRTSVTEELWRTHTLCGVPADALRQVALNGFRYAFLHFDERNDLLREAERHILNQQ